MLLDSFDTCFFGDAGWDITGLWLDLHEPFDHVYNFKENVKLCPVAKNCNPNFPGHPERQGS